MDPSLTPFLHLPVLLDAAGTASATMAARTVRGFAVVPVDDTSTLTITIGAASITLPAGSGWSFSSPNGHPFANAVTVTAAAGQFHLTKAQ